MNKDTVRNAVSAHGWVGLVISVPLFIVFWAGAITLFYPEVQRWASMPHFPLQSEETPIVPLNDLIDERIQQTPLFDDSRRTFLRLSSHHSPYLRMSIPVHKSAESAQAFADYQQQKAELEAAGDEEAVKALEKPKTGREFDSLMLDPQTGEVLAEDRPFGLASFLDRLHFTLKLPGGLYIVGIITFFFLVIVFTGVVIQLKNMISHFFLYRHQKTTRYQMNDIHNVVGVISLPYGLMYALTGVMFNLSILFQIPTMFLLYQGDMQAMMKDAGFANVEQQPTGVSYPTPDLNALISEVNQTYNTNVQAINLINYGDENALIRLSGDVTGSFAKRVDVYYQPKTQDFPAAVNPEGNNVFSDGIGLLFSIHMGDYAGVDMRMIYFLLAMGVCGMIVAGNVLWIAKRQKKAEYPKTLSVMRGLTLGGCVGVIPATAIAFMLERVLPVGLDERHHYVEYAFGVVMLISVIVAFFNQRYLSFVAQSFIASGVILLMLVAVDLAMFTPAMIGLWQNGYAAPGSVTIGLLVVSALLTLLGTKILSHQKQTAPQDQSVRVMNPA